MMSKKPIILGFVLSVCGFSGLAEAQCALPHQLTNGQVADASQVMANYNALLNCVNAGAPAGSNNAIQYKAGGGSLGGVGPLTDGQLVIGATGAAPQAQTLTAGSGISITNGAGSISISATAAGGNGLYGQILSPTPTIAMTGFTSWLNQGSATFTETPVGLTLNVPQSGGYKGMYTPVPLAPYKVKILLASTRNSTVNNAVALGWYDGTNKIHALAFINDNTSPPFFQIVKMNNPNSWNGNDYTSARNVFSNPIWMQIEDDGTNVSFGFSQDGYNFLTIYSIAKASGFLGASGYSNIAFLGAAQVGATIGTIMSWNVN